MTTLGFGAAVSPRHTLSLNIPAILTFLVFAALSFVSLIGPLSALTFIAAGLGIGALQPRLAINAVMRWCIVLILPLYCLLSMAWSQYPEATMRHALQLSATVVIGILIATRVSPGHLLRALFFALFAATLIGLLIGKETGAGAWLGIFASKNAFAAHIALQTLVATGLVLDRQAAKGLRLLALATALVSVPMLIFAQSAGALVVTGPCVAAMILVAASNYATGPQKLFVVGAAFLAVIGIATVAILFGDLLLTEMLDATGKDTTLTGRTDLWALGFDLIGDHPWLGLGYRAFWVRGFPLAEQLWAMFLVPSGSGFNFHNTYISNAVEIGLVGLSLQVVLIYVPFFILLWLAVVRPTPYCAFLLGIHLMLVMRSFIEVEVFYEFSGRTVLAICTYIHALILLREWRDQQAGDRSRFSA
jgi:exopolysaccharide production protein ExoQ